jgi:hypothetical protein
MAHKFKIGETVGYTPPRGSAHAERGRFTIVRFLSEADGKPMYRIRHNDSSTEFLARENELYKS